MFFREAMFLADCDRCGVRFDPVHGGVCAECRQVLCGAHLHGSLVQRLRVQLLGGRSVCASCRTSVVPRTGAASAGGGA